jgi:YD repeat-containing protein
MGLRKTSSFQLWLILVVLAAWTCQAQQQRKVNRELAHLPAPVRKAIRAEAGGSKITSIEENTDDEEISYDVEIVRDGKTRGFSVDDSGALLEKEVFLSELPAAARAGIEKRAAPSTIAEIEQSGKGDSITYDVEVNAAGQNRNFTVDAEGTMLEEQVLINDLPAAVKKTITQETGAHPLAEIDRLGREGNYFYTAEWTDGNQPREITVDAEGKLMEKSVELSQLPAALQTALRNQADAESDIRQYFDGDEVTYELEMGTDRTLTYDADGKLLCTTQEIDAAAAPAPVRGQIKNLCAGGKCRAVTRNVEDGQTYYEIEADTGGASKTVTLDPEGAVLSDEAK